MSLATFLENSFPEILFLQSFRGGRYHIYQSALNEDARWSCQNEFVLFSNSPILRLWT